MASGLIVMVFCIPLWAQNPTQTLPSNSGCTPQTCTQTDHDTARAEVESLYADVALILSAHERPALRSDQSAWRNRSRETCQKQARETAPAGASIDSYFYACQIEQSHARRTQLRRWLMSGYQVE